MSEGEVLVIVEVRKVHDANEMKNYQEGARAQIGPFGGVVIARGVIPVEGDPAFSTLMVQKWPSAQAFLDWQASDDYRPLKERRLKCADLRIGMVPLVAAAV